MKIVLTEAKPKGGVAILLSPDIKESHFEIQGRQETLVIPVKKDLTRRRWLLLVRQIVQEAKHYKLKNIVVSWQDCVSHQSLAEENTEHLAQLFAENALMANYEFRRYKKKPKEGWSDVETLELFVPKKNIAKVRAGVRTGSIIATHMAWCRDLANTPGNDMTPKIMVAAVRKAIRGKKLRLTVLGQKELQTKGFGGVIAVGQGSKEESQFLILEYKGTAAGKKPVVLVGKGVTFDSGGIDTKPYPHGLDMMMDMSGGASVLTVLLIAHDLKVKKNLVALVPAVENMPSGESFRPGDVIKMLDGTHVEIGNTDAEGRLILADALTYAKRFNPEAVIDVATLTGAAMVALGDRATALFTRDDILAEKALQASETSGDYAWRLPLWEEYEAEIAGNVGDIANIRTKGKDGTGGAITAATFLQHFAKDYKRFMHLDMAPTMTSAFDERLSKGAKGSPVRLLVELIKNHL